MPETTHSSRPLTRLTRRDGLTVLLSLAWAGRQNSVQAASGTMLVFAGPGGDWGAAVRSAWLDPFTAATGIGVISIEHAPVDKLRAMVRAGRVEWDIVEIPPDFQWIGVREGLLEKLDFKMIDASNVMHVADLVTDYAIGEMLWSHVMFCNTQQFPEGRQPLNWAGLWNVNSFGGKRCFPTNVRSGVLEAALLADGVKPAELYPLDIDRALKNLDRIKAHIVWWTSEAQSQQIMLEGQAVLGLVTDRSALAAIERGAQVSIQYDQSLMTWCSLVIPKGAPNRAAAMSLLNFILTPDAQAAIAMADTYGPVTPAAFEQIPPHRASMLPGGPQQEGHSLWVNERWWTDNIQTVAKTFEKWRLG